MAIGRIYKEANLSPSMKKELDHDVHQYSVTQTVKPIVSVFIFYTRIKQPNC